MSRPYERAGRSKSCSPQFPLYQIDFEAVASGKSMSTTKRHIRWRFGFPNREALRIGETGSACRGEEHDITIIWSVTSGKRAVFLDGKEVYYSNNRDGLFTFSWTMRGKHFFKVLAYADPPKRTNREFRQYDLLVDGESFFSMPKLYEVGIKEIDSSNGRASAVELPGAALGGFASGPQCDRKKRENAAVPPRTKQQEEQLLRSIQASIAESRAQLSRPSVSKRDDFVQSSDH